MTTAASGCIDMEEEENVDHLDSMSSITLVIWEKALQLKSLLTEGSDRCSQQTHTIGLGLIGLTDW